MKFGCSSQLQILKKRKCEHLSFRLLYVELLLGLMSSEPYLSSECSREHPKHVNLVLCSAPDRCNCTCHNPFKLQVDLDETPNPNY